MCLCGHGQTSDLLDISSLPPGKFKKGTRVYVHLNFSPTSLACRDISVSLYLSKYSTSMSLMTQKILKLVFS